MQASETAVASSLIPVVWLTILAPVCLNLANLKQQFPDTLCSMEEALPSAALCRWLFFFNGSLIKTDHCRRIFLMWFLALWLAQNLHTVIWICRAMVALGGPSCSQFFFLGLQTERKCYFHSDRWGALPSQKSVAYNNWNCLNFGCMNVEYISWNQFHGVFQITGSLIVEHAWWFYSQLKWLPRSYFN